MSAHHRQLGFVFPLIKSSSPLKPQLNLYGLYIPSSIVKRLRNDLLPLNIFCSYIEHPEALH